MQSLLKKSIPKTCFIGFIMENRARYCAVYSCVNNNGTFDPEIHMFKIPKDRDVANKWLAFLGIEPNLCGYVCNRHFKDEYLYKDRNRLRPIAAPATFSNNIDNRIPRFDVNDVTVATLASITPAPSVPPAIAKPKNQCEQCMEKDDRIEKLEVEIRSLKDRLQSAQKKISYLTKVRKNLDNAFNELKKQNIINEEQCKLLEVN